MVPVSADTITINTSEKVISISRFKQGVQLDYYDWTRLVLNSDRQIYLDYLKEMNCGIVRIFTYRQSTMNPDIPTSDTDNYMGPCTSWDTANHTGVFNWDNMDKTIDAILSINAEPLLVFMAPPTSSTNSRNPRGMTVDSNNLPNPEDYAAYCAQYAEHYKGKVKFYEVMNEPFQYWGWNENMVRVKLLLKVYSVCYDKIKEVDPSSIISFDDVMQVNVLNYMVSNGIHFDTFDFHNYGGAKLSDSTEYCINKASETFLDDNNGETYTLTLVKKQDVGNISISICSESNFNSAWSSGTDTRNVQTEGVCFAALQTIYALETGLSYKVHYLMSSKHQETGAASDRGYGFGILNSDDDSPFLPYYLYRLIAQNLNLGDEIVETTTSNLNIEAISWMHNGIKKTLIVNKGSIASTVSINYSGEYTKIDGKYYGTQNGTYQDSVTMEPYSTMLTSSASIIYDLTIQDPEGSGYTNPGAGVYSCSSGESVQLAASSDSGWVFDHWVKDGSNNGVNPITVIMDSDHTLKAVFTQSPPLPFFPNGFDALLLIILVVIINYRFARKPQNAS